MAQADRGPESEPGVQGVGGTRKQNDKAGLRASGREQGAQRPRQASCGRRRQEGLRAPLAQNSEDSQPPQGHRCSKHPLLRLT